MLSDGGVSVTPEERAARAAEIIEYEGASLFETILAELRAAIAEEREACARVADQYGGNAAEYIAILIRRRGVPAEGGRP